MPSANFVGLIDEDQLRQEGRIKTATVQRQHCGAIGKLENCVVSVHLGYAAGDFHTLLDGEVYLPEHTWDADRGGKYREGRHPRRGRVPGQVEYRVGTGAARRRETACSFAWLTFDEHYGSKPPFLRELDAMGADWVAEVPTSLRRLDLREPEVLRKETWRRGRPRTRPALKARNTPALPGRQRGLRTRRCCATSRGSTTASRTAARGR